MLSHHWCQGQVGCQTTLQWQRVDEIFPELLNAQDVVGLVMIDMPLQHCVHIRDCAFRVADRCGGSPFQEGGPEGVLQLLGDSHLSLGKSTLGCLRDVT